MAANPNASRTEERPHYDLDKVTRRADLVSLVEQDSPRTSGGLYRCPMPSHDDKVASFSVFRAKDGRQRYKCHSGKCGVTGDVLQYLQDVRGLGKQEAMDEAARLTGVHADESWTPTKPEPQRTRPVSTHRELTDLEDGLTRPDKATADKLLRQYIDGRDWSLDSALALGLEIVIRDGKPRARHPFRIGGRTVAAEDRRLDWLDKSPNKWMTSKGSTKIIYNADGLDHLDAYRMLYVVEGVSDTITLLDRFGLEMPVVGAPGASRFGRLGTPRNAEAERFRKGAEYVASTKGGMTVVVVGDNDEAGQNFRKRLGEVLQTETGDPKDAAAHVVDLFVPEQYNDVTEWAQGSGESFPHEWEAFLNTACVRSLLLFYESEAYNWRAFENGSPLSLALEAGGLQ